MYNYNINNTVYWPYEAIYYPNWEMRGDINPIIYDNAEIDLNWDNVSYVFCYKISKNIFWKEIKYVDIICEQTWETFSLQVSNIFMIKVIWNDLKILAKIWDNLKFYENFWKTEYDIEPDWDKKEITPLWYYNMFVRYDEQYYYPIIIDENVHSWIIKEFYDYYWYKSYIDDNWWKHLIMLIEYFQNNWFWTDNFVIFSERIYFSDDIEEIETWDISSNWIVYMETNYNKHYYLDEQGKIIEWAVKINNSEFVYTRYFEDTDTDFIVWKNNKWYFIINRFVNELNEKEKEKIIYFKNYLFYIKKDWKSFFLVSKESSDIVLVNENSDEIISTDLSLEDKIEKSYFDKEVLVIELSNWEIRKYI